MDAKAHVERSMKKKNIVGGCFSEAIKRLQEKR
jgi:hypothetical protein